MYVRTYVRTYRRMHVPMYVCMFLYTTVYVRVSVYMTRKCKYYIVLLSNTPQGLTASNRTSVAAMIAYLSRSLHGLCLWWTPRWLLSANLLLSTLSCHNSRPNARNEVKIHDCRCHKGFHSDYSLGWIRRGRREQSPCSWLWSWLKNWP